MDLKKATYSVDKKGILMTIFSRFKKQILIASLIFTNSIYVLPSVEILFSPDDRPTQRLVDEITNAKKRILAAVYMITDAKIVQALIDAHNRGLEVELITDRITIESFVGKGKLIVSGGVPLHLFNDKIKTTEQQQLTITTHHSNIVTTPKPAKLTKPKKALAQEIKAVLLPQSIETRGFRMAPIMHEKFAIIDKKLWAGSFNWTKSANIVNQENVFIFTERAVIERFKKRFEILKNRSTKLTPTIIQEMAEEKEAARIAYEAAQA